MSRASVRHALDPSWTRGPDTSRRASRGLPCSRGTAHLCLILVLVVSVFSLVILVALLVRIRVVTRVAVAVVVILAIDLAAVKQERC